MYVYDEEKTQQSKVVLLYSIDERRPSIEHTIQEHGSSGPVTAHGKKKRGFRSRLGYAQAVL